MNNNELLDFDDLGDALREGRALRPARGYRFQLAEDSIDFHPRVVADPVPLGRQLLEAAALDPGGGFSLFAILPSGNFEDVRLDEPFDLRQRGAERFIAFRTDRDFKLTLNGNELCWGKPVVSGSVLYGLAKPADGEAVYLDVPGGEDRLIEPGELVDLTAPGIERFITAQKRPPTFEIIVNARPRVVNERTVTFEQVVQIAFPGPHEPNVVFSMTYRHAASTPHAGELGAGGSVDVKKKGTIFNVTRTVQS
ncbi:MAG: hypothetical protein EOS22_04295 [Mesorhizobium sp.]|uniref:multiubiquitin domain-containing protein n=1 Tax=Mesorhizobium sp. TaxID=1871066 RepID=UPI000FE4A9B4|nr:multiubiquitin domain-containing protein [Mesorhizobium sp.]RWD31648.1 MAG: hypothetical protein EOS22_04295 [Mesorhizobium sp.]TJW70723.1 MAG: hypothetical protein E5V29_03630 [Mesorhizobium sp.]